MSSHPSVSTSLLLDAVSTNTAISTYNGHAFDIYDPSSWVFDIDEIAQALSNTCRFGGHVEFYSVAEHCCRVATLLRLQGFSERVQLIGLLHDAIEAYIGDIPRPIKQTMTLNDESILDLEKGMEYALFGSFGLLSDNFNSEWASIKRADFSIYEKEREERPKVGMGMLPAAAKRAWLQHFLHLTEYSQMG